MKSIQKLSPLSSFFLILAFIFISNISFAQRGQQDAIFLKDGSIINGKIIEIKANESITIINNCGDTWVIKQENIDRVEKKEITTKYQKIKDTTLVPKSFKYAGFYSGIQLSLLKGTMEDTPLPELGLLFTSGYQFRWGLNAGVGIGFDLMDEPYMPLVLDLKYVFRDTRVSPYFYINGGYTIALQDPDDNGYVYYDHISSFYPYYERDITAHGGYVINPGVGFKVNINGKNAFLFNLGYKYMEVQQTYKDWNNQEIDRTLKYNRLVLGISFQF